MFKCEPNLDNRDEPPVLTADNRKERKWLKKNLTRVMDTWVRDRICCCAYIEGKPVPLNHIPTWQEYLEFRRRWNGPQHFLVDFDGRPEDSKNRTDREFASILWQTVTARLDITGENAGELVKTVNELYRKDMEYELRAMELRNFGFSTVMPIRFHGGGEDGV